MDNDPEIPVLISNRNLEKYGFACFYAEQVPELKDGFWVRELEIHVGRTGSDRKKFRIPEHLLIKLSDTRKIVDHEHFNIGSGNSAGPIVKLLLERAGWNQTGDDLNAMLQLDRRGVFLATYDHSGQPIPLGSGVSLPVSKDLCWVGMILVHPELRRQGIARRIMQTCLAHARLVQRKSIVGLDATPLGKQVYDSLGFKDSFLIWRSVISTTTDTGHTSVPEAIPFRLPKIEDYLMKKKYTERKRIIEILEKISGAKNIMFSSGNQIQGFLMSRPGRIRPFIGPLIADSAEITKHLLMEALQHWREKGHDEVFIDIPEQHIGKGQLFVSGTNKGIDQVEIVPGRSFMRMYQLVRTENEFSGSARMDPDVQKQTMIGYEKTLAFMEKEKKYIVPMMYGTSGPEWS